MSRGELSTVRARSLIEEIADLKPGWVIMEGGEPLLRSDLFELLDLMRQKQLDIHLVTNGMLLNSQIAVTLKSLGIKVMISIDGAIAATYEAIRHGAKFERVMEQARDCARVGILEAINFTVMKTNAAEIPGIFELAKSIGINQITIIGFKPCQGYRNERLTPEEYLGAIRLACEGSQRTGISFFFDEPFFTTIAKTKGWNTRTPALNTGILAPSTSACIFGEYLFIDPNGDAKPCSFAPLVLGNINKESLSSIWSQVQESAFFQKIREPHSRTGPCRECLYVAECKGCRSRTFMLTGDWYASDPVCPLVK
jgi:radical SAM protein with 4Fe4S-binding SPASM domain